MLHTGSGPSFIRARAVLLRVRARNQGDVSELDRGSRDTSPPQDREGKPAMTREVPAAPLEVKTEPRALSRECVGPSGLVISPRRSRSERAALRRS